MAAIHVAIVDQRAARELLGGRKQVESRFARRRRLPYGRIWAGDQVYFKLSGGRVIGQWCVARVGLFENLTPEAIESLRARYNGGIRASDDYWRARRDCRYGVLIWLTAFRRRPLPLPVPRQYGAGWMVLAGCV